MNSSSFPQSPGGRVYFIGAGPGDPELITLKAQRLIAAADVIIYAGSLVNPAVLAHARGDAALYNSVGMKLPEQIRVMEAAVKQGQTVARLHTGDPSIYGAVLEQIRELEQRGIPYTIVPGVTSAFAAAAALGIEFTVPGDTQTVIFTRLSGRTPVPEREALARLAAHHSSMAIFLSAGMTDRVAAELLSAGYPPDTPVAVVFRASWPDEKVISGTLADIAARVAEAEITHHALIIVSPALKRPGAAVSHLYGTALDRPDRLPTTAIITLTRRGTETGLRLHRLLPDSTLYAPARFLPAAVDAPDARPYETSVRQTLQSAFQEHSALVCIMASGIVVRDLAPLLRSKHTDPAVVVVDEQGRHAVSLLSGHKGGANALAVRVAQLLGGTPVVTTASDGQGLPALDLLEKEYGWRLAHDEAMTAVIAALVNGEPVGVVQDCAGDRWLPDPPLPNLTRYPDFDTLRQAAPSAAVLVTCRVPPPGLLAAIPHTVVFHPPCLSVGVGCNRGTPAEEILAAVDHVFTQTGLSRDSIAAVATIEDKADEAGLLEACRARGWSLKIFSRAEVAAVASVPNPSAWAQKALGVPGVAEPAAMLAAGTDSLLVEKQKFPNVTVAVAVKKEEQ
ncbi:MAG: precorrin-4 C(11)-methyltransferase [Chloroflexi bacterium]|nr:MAG: precorrin-4 C(11)-methyltransferase [Chloroflexota bacterium]